MHVKVANSTVKWPVVVLYFALHTLVASAAEELVVSEHSVVNTGHHIYMRQCAVCHGRDGKGKGPFAPMLVVAPTDLTVLKSGNGGRFPFERVQEVISGNELMPAHGTRDMPIWGQRFAEEAEILGIESKTLVRTRILELTAYLDHLQRDDSDAER